MQTPDDRAGHMTELIMSRIKTQCEGHKTPQLQDGQYNRVYESVYEVLFREFGERSTGRNLLGW